MYVCMHVCECELDERRTAIGKVRKYCESTWIVCMFICMYIYVECMCEKVVREYIHSVYVCIYVCMHVCMHVCMYVCECLHETTRMSNVCAAIPIRTS
jgi:hypothetical protein